VRRARALPKPRVSLLGAKNSIKLPFGEYSFIEAGNLAVATLEFKRAPNFAEPKQWRCLTCGNVIQHSVDLYTRRFCSEKCKNDFFSSESQA
jgi:hypothetical protein